MSYKYLLALIAFVLIQTFTVAGARTFFLLICRLLLACFVWFWVAARLILKEHSPGLHRQMALPFCPFPQTYKEPPYLTALTGRC